MTKLPNAKYKLPEPPRFRKSPIFTSSVNMWNFTCNNGYNLLSHHKLSIFTKRYCLPYRNGAVRLSPLKPLAADNETFMQLLHLTCVRPHERSWRLVGPKRLRR